MNSSLLWTLILAALASSSFQIFATGSTYPQINPRQNSRERLVFAHFMIGIMSNRVSPSDYDYDMKLANEHGIDAFALNIGVDPYTNQQLDLAYQSAANNGVKVFISFDFNWWNTGQAVQIGQLVASYGIRPAQLLVDGKVYVSSFAGDGLDVVAMKRAAAQTVSGMDVMFVPNFHPGQGDFNAIDGALNWLAWPNNGFNKAPDGLGNHSVLDGDREYMKALNGKPYLAPVSPWFFTHFGPEVPYSKNWVFPSDLLWYERWEQLLTLGARWVELVTWNDYGESHYVGPLSSTHTDDGASKWVNDKPHFAWIEMAKPYIEAFKDGASSVTDYIKADRIFYWYRHNKRSLNCDATDITMVPANNASGNYFMGRPYGWESMQDEIFVVALLTSPGNLTVNSGRGTQVFQAPKGASAYRVPMNIGQQSFALARSGQNVLAGVSLRDVDEVCNCGIYNFNPYVGSVPESFKDPLGPPGINSLPIGLHVSTCAPMPSLATSAPPYTGPGGQPTATPTIQPPTSAPTITTSTSTTAIPPTASSPTTISTPPSLPTGSCTITASRQIYPTNCLMPGCVWAGPPGQETPDHCDLHHRSWAPGVSD